MDLVDRREVAVIASRCEDSINKVIKSGQFPKHVTTKRGAGDRRSRFYWNRCEVVEWVQARDAGSIVRAPYINKSEIKNHEDRLKSAILYNRALEIFYRMHGESQC